MLDPVRDWCRGREWWGRGLLLAWLAYLGVRLLLDPDYVPLFDALNLGIHEAGHLVFAWAGDFVCAAGGTILQLAAPVAAAVMFLRQPDFFAVSVAGVWLATNLYDVATYVADATDRALPLVTVGGGEAQHDWWYLLGELGIREHDGAIALLMRILAFAVLWSSVAAGAWMLWHMARPDPDAEGSSESRAFG